MAGAAGRRAAVRADRLPGRLAVPGHRLPAVHPDAPGRAMRAVELVQARRFAAAQAGSPAAASGCRNGRGCAVALRQFLRLWKPHTVVSNRKERRMTPQEVKAQVGQNVGTSEWVVMSQERIKQFAEATGDHQFIHIDEEKAKLTPFGGTIAHGFLTLSMIPYLSANSDLPKVDGVKMGVNYGGNKTRFISPVRSGKRIRGHWKLIDL